MKDQLISLFEYGEWVDQRLFRTATTLPEQQFKEKILPGFGSVHLTFVHLLGAEILWFARWRGYSPKSILSSEEVPDLTALREHWGLLKKDRRAYFVELDEDDLHTTVHWTNMRGEIFALLRWQVMYHSINHSTHHRSELAAILSQLGHEPEGTDLLEYYLELNGQQWKPSPLPK